MLTQEFYNIGVLVNANILKYMLIQKL